MKGRLNELVKYSEIRHFRWKQVNLSYFRISAAKRAGISINQRGTDCVLLFGDRMDERVQNIYVSISISAQIGETDDSDKMDIDEFSDRYCGSNRSDDPDSMSRVKNFGPFQMRVPFFRKKSNVYEYLVYTLFTEGNFNLLSG